MYPVFGVYVTTLPLTIVVPFTAAVVTAMLVDTPVICAVRSIGNGSWKVTSTDRGATTGAAGSTVMFIAADGADVPPAFVAVNWKLPVPAKPAVGVKVTMFPATMVVPLVTPVVAMLVYVPVTRPVRSILIGVLNAVLNGPGAAVTVGGAGNTVILIGPDVADDPPGPFAR